MPATETEAVHAEPVTLTRQELFDKVWSTPLLRLAPAYGVHHARLAQLCDDHEVPRPPAGYWSQKAHGKGEPPPELPPVDDPALEVVRLAHDEPANRVRAAPEPEAEPAPTPTPSSPAPASQSDPPASEPPTKAGARTDGTPPARPQPLTEEGWVTMTRQELYDLVWSAPMSQVCQDYDMSDVALAKTCKRHKVPSPPRGYWVQLRTGVGVKKPALKPVNDVKLDSIRLYRQPRQAVTDTTHQQSQDSAAAEKKPENKITVADTIDEPHPLVSRTVKSLSAAKPSERGMARPRASKCLDVSVSPALIDRAGRIMDALIRALEDRGHEVTAGDGEEPKTWVTVLGEKLSIRLDEGVNCKEKVESFLERSNEYVYTPSGVLCLRINESSSSGHRKQWSDGQKRLEEMLNQVVVGLVRMAEGHKAAREERERWDREWKVKEQRREEDQRKERQAAARAQDFEQKLDAWERACRIRTFVVAVRASAVARDGEIVPGSELDRWLTWALTQADVIDPLTTEIPGFLRWPPPAGHTVKMTDSRNGSWWKDGTNGTPVLPPGPLPEPPSVG